MHELEHSSPAADTLNLEFFATLCLRISGDLARVRLYFMPNLPQVGFSLCVRFDR